MNHHLDLLPLRRSAAEIAAAAVYELYPDVELLGGGETSTGFTYEFLFPHVLHTHIIEEKMRAIVQERRVIKTLDMVPFSAREFLKSKGLLARADEIEDEGLVQLIQLGDFVDLMPGPHLKNTFELAAFKIEAEKLDEKRMRIVGWCHHSKHQLKQFLKVLARFKSGQLKGEELGFWKGDIWFASGIEAREKLLRFLKKEWGEGALEVSGPLRADVFSLHEDLNRAKVLEITRGSPGETTIQISFFNKRMDDWNSCLQMIGKTLTILGFDHSNIPLGGEIGHVVVDELGRSHTLVQMKKVEKKGASTVDFYVTAVVEPILSQMLEKNLYDGRV